MWWKFYSLINVLLEAKIKQEIVKIMICTAERKMVTTQYLLK